MLNQWKFEDYRHALRPLALLGAALLAFILLRMVVQPESFGNEGHYRGNAVLENVNHPIVHQSEKTCASCHKKNTRLHRLSVHRKIACVNCHRPGKKHAAFFKAMEGKSKKDIKLLIKPEHKMQRKYTRNICLSCHNRLKARPVFFSQISRSEHYKQQWVNKPKTKCVSCHNPHSPMFLGQDRKQGHLHPMVSECSSCHSDPVNKYKKLPKKHVEYFRCGNCHKQVAKDLSKKAHATLRCLTCHSYVKKNSVSVLMYKNTSQQFCMLCHATQKFKMTKSDKSSHKIPPPIDIKEHREENDEDYEGKIWKKPCVKCHMSDEIHDRFLFQPSKIRKPVKKPTSPTTPSPTKKNEPPKEKSKTTTGGTNE